MEQLPSICYLTFDSLNEGVGQSQIIPLVKGLASLGHAVTIISFEKIENTGIGKDLKEHNIDWLPFSFGRNGIVGLPKRIYLMSKNLPAADIFHCRSDLPVLALALRRKRKFLWDVRSLWYDQKVIINNGKYSKIISFFARRLERFAARNASAVNTLAAPLLNVLESRNGRIPELRTVIPTCVDTLKFAYQESVRTEKTILLSGTLNNFYDIASTKNLIKAFHAAGFRIEWAKGVESNQSNLDEDFVVTTHLIYSEMPAKVSQASFGMAICRTDCSDVLKGVMPTKIAEFLAVGRPVIISPGMGDLDRLISETKTGILVRKGMTEADVVQEAIDLLKDYELSQRCRNLAESYFSMNRAILKYSDIYRRMLVQK